MWARTNNIHLAAWLTAGASSAARIQQLNSLNADDRRDVLGSLWWYNLFRRLAITVAIESVLSFILAAILLILFPRFFSLIFWAWLALVFFESILLSCIMTVYPLRAAWLGSKPGRPYPRIPKWARLAFLQNPRKGLDTSLRRPRATLDPFRRFRGLYD